MVSLVTTVVGIAPMALMLSLSAFIYKWEQQDLEAESIAEEYIHTCRNAAYTEIHTVDNGIPKNQMSKWANSQTYYQVAMKICFTIRAVVN